MLFKEERFRKDFWKLKSKTRRLATEVDYLLWIKFKKQAILTCLFYKGGSGVHADGRGFDIRTTDYLTKTQREWVKNYINKNFIYDKNRPWKKTCIYHKVSEKKIEDYKLKDFKPQYHLHFQVWVV